MKIPHLRLLSVLLLAAAVVAKADTETIVFLRHGEKTVQELGQLNVRGLNRSLALPDVLLAKFGTPQYIFAPDPARNLLTGKHGSHGYFDYIRPLATIEPTAIRLGMPVNTSFGFEETAGLERELLAPRYRNAVIFVAWEHNWEDRLAAKLVADLGGAAGAVPNWPSGDYDSLYVVRIERSGGKTTVSFQHDHEGLDSRLTDRFPSPASGGKN